MTADLVSLGLGDSIGDLDAVLIESLGVCAVLLLTAGFFSLAAGAASGLGRLLPLQQVVPIPHSLQMDSTALLKEADSLLEQSSERLKQAQSRQETDLSRDTLIEKFKAALSSLQHELQEERKQRQYTESQLSSSQALCQSIQSSLSSLQSQYNESLRLAIRKKESEIRDQCALREAQLKIELKTAVAQLEEELETAAEGQEQEREEKSRLEAEVRELKGKLRAEMETRLSEKAQYKAALEKQRAALRVKLAAKPAQE